MVFRCDISSAQDQTVNKTRIRECELLTTFLHYEKGQVLIHKAMLQQS